MPRTKTRGTSKSQLIRLFLSDHPRAKPREIKEALAAKGVEVTDSLISQIKYSKKRRSLKGERKPGRKALTGHGVGNGLLDNLIAAKKLADAMGGTEKARSALEMLARLQ